MQLEILYQDDALVAVDKPSGVFVHPTRLDPSVPSCLPVLRDQIGKWVFPVHRLDRGTSGVLLFALSREAARFLNQAFEERRVEKEYLALVRGFMPEAGKIDYAYRPPDSAGPADAVTEFSRLESVELPFAVGRYPTVRYSLVRALPLTGRQHQIRRHFAHLRHPVIGDQRYGDLKHNRFFASQFNLMRLMLAATRLRFLHPQFDREIEIIAPVPLEMARLFEGWGWGKTLSEEKGKGSG